MSGFQKIKYSDLSECDKLVSILIPVYNREQVISETIESALSQTYKNIEVIIVDNASTDKSWQIIQRFSAKDSRIKAIKNEINIGPVPNWLRCVKEAKGEYGKILWSDDLITCDFIEKAIQLFHEEVGFVYSGAKIFTGENPSDGISFYLLPKTGYYLSEFYLDKAIFDDIMPVSPGCAIFRMSDLRKNLWLQIPNKINSDFSMHAIGNDLMLFLLTARDYKYFGHIAEPLAFFRAHNGSISINSKGGKLPLHYTLVRSYFVENNLPSNVGKLAAKIKLMLWQFKDAKQFKINSVNDFFIKKTTIDYVFLVLLIFKKIIFGIRQLKNKFLDEYSSS